jgi:branched-subunit amino acid transport protein
MGDLLQPWHLMVLIFVFSLIVFPFRVLPFWFICKKAGFSPWLSLLYVVPFGGLVLNFVLAFGEWTPQRAWTQQPPYPPQA